MGRESYTSLSTLDIGLVRTTTSLRSKRSIRLTVGVFYPPQSEWPETLTGEANTSAWPLSSRASQLTWAKSHLFHGLQSSVLPTCLAPLDSILRYNLLDLSSMIRLILSNLSLLNNLPQPQGSLYRCCSSLWSVAFLLYNSGSFSSFTI